MTSLAPDVAIRRLTAPDRSLIENLLQLYIYDMTEFWSFDVGPDGLFVYDMLDRFWQNPYLIETDGHIAGFALVIESCPLTGIRCWFMAEFFILKTHRGQGIGRHAVDQLLALHPGNWHIASIIDNHKATAFWQAVLAPRAPERQPITFDGSNWLLSRFSA